MKVYHWFCYPANLRPGMNGGDGEDGGDGGDGWEYLPNTPIPLPQTPGYYPGWVRRKSKAWLQTRFPLVPMLGEITGRYVWTRKSLGNVSWLTWEWRQPRKGVDLNEVKRIEGLTTHREVAFKYYRLTT